MNTLSFMKNNVDGFFSSMIDLAQPVTITKKANPTYNATTGAVTAVTSTVSANGLLLRFRNSEIDGKLVLRDDRRLLVPYSSVAIDISDEITVASVVYQILNVRGDILNSYWDLQLRKK